jgi:DNA replication protein DnaC
MTATPTPQPDPEHPPRELSAADRALLAPDAARADHGARAEARQRLDFDAWAERVKSASAPRRQQQAAERTARQRRIDEQRRDRVVAATLDRLGRRFGRFTAEAPEHPSIVRATIAMGRGQLTGLVIQGTVGTGKTHEAVAAYRRLVTYAHLLPAVAVAVPALLDGLRPGRDPVEPLDACEGARLLLLDDLAAERVTDWTAETLYRLIDARYARALPTIITTNATGAAIRSTLGDRIASRLNGLGMTVVLDGPDRRDPRHREPAPTSPH